MYVQCSCSYMSLYNLSILNKESSLYCLANFVQEKYLDSSMYRVRFVLQTVHHTGTTDILTAPCPT